MTRVYLISRCGLLCGGVESLLRQEPGMLVVGSGNEVDRALEQIARLHPDVVVVSDCDPAADVLPIVSRLLAVQTDIRVVAVNSQNEVMAVYSGEQRPAGDLDSLLAAVRGQAGQSGRRRRAVAA